MRWSRQILFGDVDAMFASAAVVKDPSLPANRSRSEVRRRGIIAAASYAVRAIRRPLGDADGESPTSLPQLILIPPDSPLYRQLHEQMQAVTDQLFPLDRMEQHRRVLCRHDKATNPPSRSARSLGKS